MGVALHSYKVDTDGRIRVRHTFYAETEAEAEQLKLMHAGGCKAYGPAVKAEETIDEVVHDVEPPTEDDAIGYDGDIGEDDDDVHDEYEESQEG